LFTLLYPIATTCNLAVASLLLQILLYGTLNMNHRRLQTDAIEESDTN
jgi:hypothetical protein